MYLQWTVKITIVAYYACSFVSKSMSEDCAFELKSDCTIVKRGGVV